MFSLTWEGVKKEPNEHVVIRCGFKSKRQFMVWKEWRNVNNDTTYATVLFDSSNTPWSRWLNERKWKQMRKEGRY